MTSARFATARRCISAEAVGLKAPSGECSTDALDSAGIGRGLDMSRESFGRCEAKREECGDASFWLSRYRESELEPELASPPLLLPGLLGNVTSTEETSSSNGVDAPDGDEDDEDDGVCKP